MTEITDLTRETQTALGKRNVRIEFLAETTEDIENFMSEGETERPWEVFELTQSQDVRDWIEKPDTIDLLQPMLRALVTQIENLPRPVRILDAGCYGGYVYDYLDQHGFKSREDFEYVGIDVQESAIAAAKTLHEGCENATFQTGDIYKLLETFGPNSFDVVLCYRVMIHIPHFKECVRNLCGVSRNIVHTALWVGEEPRCRRCRETDLDTEKSVIYYHRWTTSGEIETAAWAAGAIAEIDKQSDNPMHYAIVTFSKAGAAKRGLSRLFSAFRATKRSKPESAVKS